MREAACDDRDAVQDRNPRPGAQPDHKAASLRPLHQTQRAQTASHLRDGPGATSSQISGVSPLNVTIFIFTIFENKLNFTKMLLGLFMRIKTENQLCITFASRCKQKLTCNEKLPHLLTQFLVHKDINSLLLRVLCNFHN